MLKVSVIIPVYNAEAYLRQCLDSVVNQTLKDIEIICVDDGSADFSTVILNEYAAKDARINIFTQVNSGQGAAMTRSQNRPLPGCGRSRDICAIPTPLPVGQQQKIM